MLKNKQLCIFFNHMQHALAQKAGIDLEILYIMTAYTYFIYTFGI